MSCAALSLPPCPASSAHSIHVVSFCSRFLVSLSFRHAHLSSGTSFPRYGPIAVVHTRNDLVCALTIGPRFCGYHPRHVDLRVFWCCRSVWSVSPFRLCAPHPAPPLFFLCCCKPHLPACGRFLRRGHCNQVLWRIYQVRRRTVSHTRDERRRLMRRAQLPYHHQVTPSQRCRLVIPRPNISRYKPASVGAQWTCVDYSCHVCACTVVVPSPSR